MRTYDEITADINSAIDSSDSSALFVLADEMSALDSADASTAAIHARARAYRLTGAYPEALEQYHRVLEMYENAGNRVGMASTHIGLGIVHHLQGMYTETLIHYHRALELNKELGLRVGEAATLGNIGNVYQSLGSYPEALEYYKKALDIHDELGDRAGLANDACNIGILFNAIGSNAEALEYYQRSLSLHQEIGDRVGIAKVTHNLGIAHADSGDLTAAVGHFETALAMNVALNYPAGIAHVTGNYIDVLIRSGDLDTASTLQDQHTTMLLTVPGVKAGHFINKARILEHHNDLKGASDSLHDALRIAADAGIRGKVADIHRHLRELALKQNDLAAYVEHNNEYIRITEEINGKDTAARLATQEAERRIASERQEHQKQIAILHSTLPKHIAERVARGETVNDHFDNTAVIFLDIVGFTALSEQLSSAEVVQLLDTVFTALDNVCVKHDVVKIKTIGDSYMAVAFPLESSSSEQRAASAAIAMLHAISHIVSPASFPKGSPAGSPLQVRIGLHIGPVTAGIIGTQRMQYDVWGDTVNTASRMESTSEPGRIQVSSSFALALAQRHQDLRPRDPRLPELRQGETDVIPSVSEEPGTSSPFPVPCSLRERGALEIKGKGLMTTYWLEGA